MLLLLPKDLITFPIVLKNFLSLGFSVFSTTISTLLVIALLSLSASFLLHKDTKKLKRCSAGLPHNVVKEEVSNINRHFITYIY